MIAGADLYPPRPPVFHLILAIATVSYKNIFTLLTKIYVNPDSVRILPFATRSG